jgi:hypothetical protein
MDDQEKNNAQNNSFSSISDLLPNEKELQTKALMKFLGVQHIGALTSLEECVTLADEQYNWMAAMAGSEYLQEYEDCIDYAQRLGQPDIAAYYGMLRNEQLDSQ